ncbi:MAG: radical SAM protein, partial [Spirochaetaceae bacterium]|nr:radical SAM protein [Spirochaetaceae bacterium]
MIVNNIKHRISFRDLRDLLISVEKPGRYVGGEYGAVIHAPAENDFTICIVFPDLYEIGMSNQAVRILYKLFNDRKGLHAERSFSPAPDFEKGLKVRGIPLYSLESGIPISDFDLLAVTIGYELSFTNFLSFLNAGGIPLRRENRKEEHPLVIAGGPAMTNPVPWADFIDAVFIGEAEG